MQILVTYSSGYGTTREISEEISKILKNSHKKIDVKSVDDVKNISPYDCVIIGSSVRADRPMANVRDFFWLHSQALCQKKVAMFAVCLTASNDKGRQKVREEYLKPFLKKFPKIKPIDLAAFGGKINFDQLNPVMQSLMKRVLAKTGLPTKGSIDTRDWTQIKNWALKIQNLLES